MLIFLWIIHVIYVAYFNTTRYHLLSCYVQSFRRDQFRSYAMEFIYFVNLILILIVNILFFFSGICLNSLVKVGFWGSVQLRKKLCYFLIMVLSCCDLLVVLTNHPFTALVTILWLTEKINVYPSLLLILQQVLDVSLVFLC